MQLWINFFTAALKKMMYSWLHAILLLKCAHIYLKYLKIWIFWIILKKKIVVHNKLQK